MELVKYNNAEISEAQIFESEKPAELTHTLAIDILNMDGTLKRVEINFCSSDQWSGYRPGLLNVAELLFLHIKDAIISDKSAVGYQETLLNRTTGKPVDGLDILPIILKPDFFAASH